MKEEFQIVIPFNVYSASAVSAARRYVTLVAEQISQAHAKERNEAVQIYREISNPDEADYDMGVRSVDRDFEEGFFQILYLNSVVYLYMIFETYVSRHITGIQRFCEMDSEILSRLKKKNNCGIVEATQIYFNDHANINFFTDDQWGQLKEIAHVRHCIVHDAGIPRDSNRNRDSIYKLEKRIWRDQPVGLQIDRYQGRDLGCPMNLNQRFLEYCLSVIEEFFDALGTAAEGKFKESGPKNP